MASECSDSGGGGTSRSSGPPVSSIAAEVGPVIAWAPGWSQNMDAAWTATVVYEGDCVLLEAVDGQRWLVVWPIGTTWDAGTASVALPDGTEVHDRGSIDAGGGILAYGEDSRYFADEALGGDGAAHLRSCAAQHPDLAVAAIDADGVVQVASR